LNDDLQPLKNRLRWLNRSILVLGVLILLGLIVWAVVGLRKPTPGTESTVIHPASSASNRAARAASAVAAAAPKLAMSTAQQERAAAAAMDALSAASAPKTAATASQAARVASAAAPTQTASAPAPAPTAVVETASSAVTAAAPSKPVAKPVAKPKPEQHKPAVQARTEPARAAATPAKPKRVGAVGVCRTAGWYVQVGAFGKQQSIDRLASKLHRAGYTQVCVAAQQVRGLHLFYVGPYRNAASARDAKAPLHKLTGAEGILRKLG
jgi:cell division protein FtsN